MKYLTDYTNAEVSRILDFYGAFFAFSTEQFEASRKPGVAYVNTPCGMLVPKDNLNALTSDLDRVYKNGIKQDVAENGLTAIIERELRNHECYYTGDITDCVEALRDYPVTVEDIETIYRENDSDL